MTAFTRTILAAALASLAFSWIAPGAAAATSTLSCKGRIIQIGDTRFEVLSKCGEPASRETRLEKRISRDCRRSLLEPFRDGRRCPDPIIIEDFVEIEEWIYNPGPTGLLKFLYFQNGRLVNIVTGDYGF